MKIAFLCPIGESLGIQYISAILKREGFEVELFFDPYLFDEHGFLQYTVLKKIFSVQKDILTQLSAYQPDIVGIHVLSDSFPWASDWAKLIKQHMSVPIVMGGIHVSSVPDEVIKHSAVDFLCVGEGEYAFLELCQRLRDGKSIDCINNIWVKRDGFVRKNPVRELIDLNKLPFPDKDLFYSKYPFFKETYTICMSRGCMFNCSYCCNSIFKKMYSGRYYRRRNIDHVMQELRHACSTYQPSFFYFWDDEFNESPDKTEEFLKAYKKEINVPFGCYMNPALITAATVSQLKDSGCIYMRIGVQSLNEQLCKQVLGRNSDTSKIKKVIEWSRKVDLFCGTDNLLGIPGETKKDIERLLDFYMKHPPGDVLLFWLRYYPGTEITTKSVADGILSGEQASQIREGYLAQSIVMPLTKRSYYGAYAIFLNVLPFLSVWTRKVIVRFKLFYLFPYIPFFSHWVRFYCRCVSGKRPVHDVIVNVYMRKYAFFVKARIKKFFFLRWIYGK